MATWDDVGRIVGELPETTEASPRDWRVRKKLMAWERPLRKADYAALGADAPDGDILGARVADEGVKFALIADEPGVYFTTPHFDGYPMVLVRLAEIDLPELEELLTEAWLAQAPKTLAKAFLQNDELAAPRRRIICCMAATDPTFYRSPGAAVAAAPEQLAYVVAFDPAGQAKDALAVVDCDSASSSYGQVVGWSELPTAGNELHHFGWNACSSALCHEGHDGHHRAALPPRPRHPVVEHVCPRHQTRPAKPGVGAHD